MCGIAGLFARDGSPVDPRVARAMTEALAHRGPDDAGLWHDGRIAFGHRRLAIRDLSPAGHQPMSDPSGRVTITYNGEIFNDAELRRELARDFGCTFRSTCDAETIPLAYLAWGEAAFDRLEGQFAIALWDRAEETLFLVRDGVGIKPLFYSDDGRLVRFASELKGLLADPAQRRTLSPAMLHRYFSMGYVGPGDTTLEGVRQVEPGTIVAVGRRGRSTHRFWQPQRTALDIRDEADALDAFMPIWEKVVDDQMISDVPVGVLQSGGIDSSLVSLTVAPRHKVPLFTAGFAERSHDESDAARQVAQLAGLEHHIVPVDDRGDLDTTLEAVVHHFDGQVCDESAIPLYLLCRKVREHVTVALSGDGGDEFFGGYQTYWASRIACLAGLATPGPLAAMVGKLAYAAAARREDRLSPATLLARFGLGLADGRQVAHARWRRLIPAFQLADVYGPALRPALPDNPFRDYESHLLDAGGSLLDRCLLADQRYHLPAGLLMKSDAMSMAHALELRVPLLDRRIMDFAGRCDGELLAPMRGPSKRLLRAALRRYHAPEEVLKGTKRGFNTPLARLLRTQLSGLAERHFDTEVDRLAPYLEPAGVRRVWQEHKDRRANHAYTLWPILTCAIWLEQAGRLAGYAPRDSAMPADLSPPMPAAATAP
jgi:asparagine synthase (glutamine-hydrolysing)